MIYKAQRSISLNVHQLKYLITPIIWVLGIAPTLIHAQKLDCITITNDPINITKQLVIHKADSIIDFSKKEIDKIKAWVALENLDKPKTNDIYLAKVELCNQSDYNHLILEVDRNKLSHFKVNYFDTEANNWITKHTGEFESTRTQQGYFPFQSENNHLAISIPLSEPSLLYFYFRNDRKYSYTDLDLSIMPANAAYFNKINSKKASSSLVTGMFIFLIILSAIFFHNTKDRTFLFYALYLLSLILWIHFKAGSFDILLKYYLFPNNPHYTHFIDTVIISYIFYISFLWYFGDVFSKMNRGRTYHRYWIGYILAYLPVLIGLNFYTNGNSVLFFKLGLIFNAGMLVFTINAIRLLWQLRRNSNIHYVIIGLFMMLGLTLTASTEIIANGFDLPEFSVIALFFVVEILFFLWAIGNRYQKYIQIEAESEIIANSLKEKDTLLREIHHRVKNNLQVISALLTLQSRHIKDNTALEALKEGQGRVQSMALIHQDLYQHDNLKGVNAKDYFENLIANLIHTYKTEERNIELKCEIQPLNLDVDTMIPLGLVVNELTSNALKHAFNNKENGKIKINLHETNNQLQLIVEDNGDGTELIQLQNKSFGYSLIKSFARRLDAELIIENKGGLHVALLIKNYIKAA